MPDLNTAFMARCDARNIRNVWNYHTREDKYYTMYRSSLLQDFLCSFPLDVIAQLNSDELTEYITVRGDTLPTTYDDVMQRTFDFATPIDLVFARQLLYINRLSGNAYSTITQTTHAYDIIIEFTKYIDDVQTWRQLTHLLDDVVVNSISDVVAVSHLNTILVSYNGPTVMQALMSLETTGPASNLFMQMNIHQLIDDLISSGMIRMDNQFMRLYDMYPSDVVSGINRDQRHLTLKMAMFLISEGHKMTAPIVFFDKVITRDDMDILISNYDDRPFIDMFVTANELRKIKHESDFDLMAEILAHTVPGHYEYGELSSRASEVIGSSRNIKLINWIRHLGIELNPYGFNTAVDDTDDHVWISAVHGLFN